MFTKNGIGNRTQGIDCCFEINSIKLIEKNFRKPQVYS